MDRKPNEIHVIKTVVRNLLSSFAPNELRDKLSALTISGFIWKLLKPSETIALPTSRGRSRPKYCYDNIDNSTSP